VQSKIGRDMLPLIFMIVDDIVADPETDLTTDAELIVSVLRGWGFECPTGLDGNEPRMSPDADMAEVEESSGCTAWHEALREINSGILRGQPAAGYPSFVTYFSIVDPTQLTAGDVYWDDPATGPEETKFTVIADALDAAAKGLLEDYASYSGGNMGVWPWGRKHGFILQSALAALNSLFNVYDNPPGDGTPRDGSEDFFANRGGLFTVDVANPNSEGLHSSGPSTRFQCEATVPTGTVDCTIQLPGGQSGHLGNDNYEDLLLLWLDRDPLPLEFDINAAKANAAVTVDYRQ